MLFPSVGVYMLGNPKWNRFF